MIIGTAGHVDHGKSALVRALTGNAMDRLAEEQRRGITIELGFTSLVLDGERCGVVDVPGHEDFVRTMVAGASGIDVALLVIAADDGIMPQTREHLLVLEELGVAAGIPVITKADLAEPDWLDLVRDEVDAWLAASPVRFAPAVALSVRTGQGMEALRMALTHARAASSSVPTVNHALPAAHDDLFRLPVDRAFVVAGTGTVVTGTAWSGIARIGDELEIWPGALHARLRGIEVHGSACTSTLPGQRTACALNGVTVQEVARGAVLVHPGQGWRESSRLDVELHQAQDVPPLRDGHRAWIHLGTAAIQARVRLAAPLLPGGKAAARLSLASPIVARGGDRFVTRGGSPLTVIGGGIVLDPQPVIAKPHPGWAAALPVRLAGLASRRRWGIGEEELPVLAGLPPGAPGDASIANALARAGLTRHGGRIVPANRLDALLGRAIEVVAAHHHAHPHDAGMPLELVRQRLAAPPALAAAVLQAAVDAGTLRRSGDHLAMPGFQPRPARSAADIDRVRQVLERDGLTPRPAPDLARELGFDPLPVLRDLERAGLAASLTRDLFAAASALDGFRAVLEACGAAGTITVQAVRERTGLSRKHLIPLLEWADRAGVTRREGDVRHLLANSPRPAAR